MWTNPVDVELSTIWQTLHENNWFLMQKYETESQKTFKGIWATVQNVFEMKQPLYRIVFRAQKVPGTRTRMVAAADTLKEIKVDWDWLQSNYHS